MAHPLYLHTYITDVSKEHVATIFKVGIEDEDKTIIGNVGDDLSDCTASYSRRQ
jgi:hypothetical protein